ncbi:hypothetical protein DPMN_116221 [Dreissena polymorpha]|uniref:C1q domain-containing protein n=2 Tax=Dreissena polymorpha TaxID=45954 RepID=A0A9D4QU45_DREPO|nr:hypothetical protein DPMN_116221 [Dreissena polymorpha]
MALWLMLMYVLVGTCYYIHGCEDLQIRVASLEAAVQQQNATILTLLAAISEQTNAAKDMEDLKQEVDALRRKGDNVRGRRQTEAFGFTAYHDREEALNKGDTLKFSRTLYNANSMYNPDTGVVTIPLDGTYIFSVTIEHWQTQELRCYLLVNGANMIDVIIYPDGKSTQSSNTAVLGLNVGSTVRVTCDQGNVFGADGFRGTTFSGVYLYGF